MASAILYDLTRYDFHSATHWVRVFILIFLFQSCSDGEGSLTVPSSKEANPSARVYSDFTLRNDPTLQITLYLPSAYDGKDPLPLLLGFDSHARGDRVVGLYQSLAEEKGFILAVSNDSRNGQGPQQSLRIASTTIDDLKARLSIDPKRIYLTGFSGGARVAALAAQNRSDITGVIGCAAGYQPDIQRQNFSYYGIVGVEDFNFLELRSLDRMLETSALPYRIQTWNGGHTWPEETVIAKAWEWMEFRAMASGIIPKDPVRIEALRTELVEEIDKCEGADCYELNKLMYSYLVELDNVEGLKAEIRRLAEEKASRDEQARTMSLEAKEIALREKYQHDIYTMGPGYWQTEVSRLIEAGKPETGEGWMHRRILGFISLLAYSYSNRSLGMNDLASAEKYIEIYELVDPQNSEHAYFKAKLRMRQGRQGEAISALQNAVGLGFDDRTRMANDPDFLRMEGDPAFQHLLGQLRDGGS